MNGRALITGSADPRIERGAEVLAIDHRPMATLLAQLAGRLPIDGHVSTGIAGALSNQFEFWYDLHIARPPGIRDTVPTVG